jgi:hypothetical protein
VAAEPKLPEPPKLTEFRPLTKLPWSAADPNGPVTLQEEALRSIFRESDDLVRYRVLTSYLRRMPVEELGRVLDWCIEFEGAQMPDYLLSYFIPIWAERDPKACLERVKFMVKLVALDDSGWLRYDHWAQPRIEIREPGLVRSSKFWVARDSLLTFPTGLARSAVGQIEREGLQREFSLTWFRRFDGWPGEPIFDPDYLGAETKPDTASAFELPISKLEEACRNIQSVRDGAFYEIGVRRRLVAEPARALELVEEIEGKVWKPESWKKDVPFPAPIVCSCEPSVEFLQIWAEVDMPAMLRWSDSLSEEKKTLAMSAKGLLLSRVDAPLREHWLQEAAKNKRDTELLLGHWVRWDFQSAWKAARENGDLDLLITIGRDALLGDKSEPENLRHARSLALAKIDVSTLPADAQDVMMYKTCVYLMEGWGNINIGETARYGTDLLLKTGHVPRNILIGLFKGGSDYGDGARGDGDVLDRTFCSLRVWAVTRPDEMKAWLATMKDAEMREALTWLLENPWGTGDPEE